MSWTKQEMRYRDIQSRLTFFTI
ncbi:MAG: hypothetical protein QOE48_980, partial [Mycobacterium sp.]|nr:hypothetical protein [Mycobacterium sp.]